MDAYNLLVGIECACAGATVNPGYAQADFCICM